MELRQRHQLIKRSGFSLIEVLLVMGVLGIITAVSFTGYVSARRRAAIAKEASGAETVIRQAMHRALTARNGQNWGVVCQGDRLQTFSYTPVTRTDAEITRLASGVRCQGNAEVRFQKLVGVPETASTFVMQADGNAFRQIDISLAGVVTASTL